MHEIHGHGRGPVSHSALVRGRVTEVGVVDGEIATRSTAATMGPASDEHLAAGLAVGVLRRAAARVVGTPGVAPVVAVDLGEDASGSLEDGDLSPELDEAIVDSGHKVSCEVAAVTHGAPCGA